MAGRTTGKAADPASGSAAPAAPDAIFAALLGGATPTDDMPPADMPAPIRCGKPGKRVPGDLPVLAGNPAALDASPVPLAMPAADPAAPGPCGPVPGAMAPDSVAALPGDSDAVAPDADAPRRTAAVAASVMRFMDDIARSGFGGAGAALAPVSFVRVRTAPAGVAGVPIAPTRPDFAALPAPLATPAAAPDAAPAAAMAAPVAAADAALVAGTLMPPARARDRDALRAAALPAAAPGIADPAPADAFAGVSAASATIAAPSRPADILPPALPQPMPAAPTAPRPAPERLVARIDTLRDLAGTQGTRLTLVEAQLGRIRVDLWDDGDSTSIALASDDPRTGERIASAADSLRAQAAERGVRLGTVDILPPGTPRPAAADAGAPGGGGQQPSPRAHDGRQDASARSESDRTDPDSTDPNRQRRGRSSGRGLFA